MAQFVKYIELRPLSSVDTPPSMSDEDGYDYNSHQDYFKDRDETNASNNHRPNSHVNRQISPLDAGRLAASPALSEVPRLDNVQVPVSITSSTFRNPVCDLLSEHRTDGSSQSSSYGWGWGSSSIHTEGKGPRDTSLAGEKLKKILQLLEKMRATVVRHLLVLQVVLFVISLLLSGMVFMPIALVFKGFRDQCVLFSDISLVWNNNKTVTVDLTSTHYGSEKDCQVPTFIAVCVFVVCVIFSWFYMCSIFSERASDDNKQSTNRIQIPALFIFLGLFISSIVAASKISAGFRVWCHNIVDNAPAGPDRKLSCSDFEELEWNNNINNYQFYTRFRIAEVACWLLCVSLFVLCCVTCIGCYQMLRVADELMHSQLTLSVTLEESDDGSFVVVNSKRKEKAGNIDDSSQDYYTPMEYAEQELTQEGDKERLLSTEATVHSENEPKDNSCKLEQDKATLNDVFLSDISDGEGFVESENVASLSINSSDGDEVALPSYNNGGFTPHSGDEDLTLSEKKALAKKLPTTAGYGAVSPYR